MKNFIIKNWKTTVSGLLILAMLGIYLLNKITTEQFLTATAFMVSVGLIASKDGDETGVKK
jgi:hypothetical protein